MEKGPSSSLCMSCSFRLGRQEDAHEYLVSLLDAMHEAILAGIHPKPPREVAQTSFIYRIFGGTCRSQVQQSCSIVGILAPQQLSIRRSEMRAQSLSGHVLLMAIA